jgi:hypothetical protein
MSKFHSLVVPRHLRLADADSPKAFIFATMVISKFTLAKDISIKTSRPLCELSIDGSVTKCGAIPGSFKPLELHLHTRLSSRLAAQGSVTTRPRSC